MTTNASHASCRKVSIFAGAGGPVRRALGGTDRTARAVPSYFHHHIFSHTSRYPVLPLEMRSRLQGTMDRRTRMLNAPDDL